MFRFFLNHRFITFRNTNITDYDAEIWGSVQNGWQIKNQTENIDISKLVIAMQKLPENLSHQISKIIEVNPSSIQECLAIFSEELGEAWNQVQNLNLPIDSNYTTIKLNNAFNDGQTNVSNVVTILLRNLKVHKTADIVTLIRILKVFTFIEQYYPGLKGLSASVPKSKLCSPLIIINIAHGINS